VQFANNHPMLRAWAIEGTGGHGAGLSRHLVELSEIVIELDRPKRAARRNGAKSDPLDAIRAAREAMARPPPRRQVFRKPEGRSLSCRVAPGYRGCRRLMGSTGSKTASSRAALIHGLFRQKRPNPDTAKHSGGGDPEESSQVRATISRLALNSGRVLRWAGSPGWGRG
jgi:hypothetical protein